MKCKYCNGNIYPTDAFCIYCGKELSANASVERQNLADTKEVTNSNDSNLFHDSDVICTCCGRRILETDRYCIYCGQEHTTLQLNESSISIQLADSSVAYDVDAKVHVSPSEKKADVCMNDPIKGKSKKYSNNQEPLTGKAVSKSYAVQICIGVSVFVVFILVLALVYFSPVRTTYRSAMSFYNAGDYEEAICVFGSILEYKDSAVMKNNCVYLLAEQKADNGDYVNAISLYEQLGSYKDTSQKITECSYTYALELINSEKWAESYWILVGISDYLDSSELSYQCVESLIDVAVNNLGNHSGNEVLDAIDELNAISGNNDTRANALIVVNEQKLLYSQATAWYSLGNVAAALDVLLKCNSSEATQLYYKILGESSTGASNPSSGLYLVTAQPNLRVRVSPNIQSSIIGKLMYGEYVEILEISNGWGRLDYNGQTGWSSMEYLELIG